MLKRIFVFLVGFHSLGLGYAQQLGQVKVDINSGNPNFPFPQFLDYGMDRKTLASQNAPGVTHAEMEQITRDAWQIFANGFFYTNVTVNGVQYIQGNKGTNDCGYDCSEGDGYALLGAAYMADKTTFDGLWMRTHDVRMSKYPRYQDGVVPNPSYQYGSNSLKDNTDAATDGDVDIALALLVAYKQWGEFMGVNDSRGNPISYKQEALNVIRGLVERLNLQSDPNRFDCRSASGDVGFDGYIKNGNTWNELTGWTANDPQWCPNWPGPLKTHIDYTAPGYFHAFANFLSQEGGTAEDLAWNINQFKRVEASSDWLMGQHYAASNKNIPSAGDVSLDGSNTAQFFLSNQGGEDFRFAWRTVLNYVWHGNAVDSWDPVTHQVIPNQANTFERDMGNRYGQFMKNQQGLPWNHPCRNIGDMAPLLTFKGPYTVIDGYDPDGTIAGTFPSPKVIGGGAPCAIVPQDFELMGEVFRFYATAWDASTEGDGYITSVPKYMHGWFRHLGLMVLSGNHHSPMNMVAQPSLKVYHKIDKTYAFTGDQVTYTISYRNYGKSDAKGVKISFGVPKDFTLVNASNGGALSGDSIVWNIKDGANGTIGFKTHGLSVTMDSLKVTFKIGPNASGRYCTNAHISWTGGAGWTSNEYPNNQTAVMERNCVDVVKRALRITKSSDRKEYNPGQDVKYKIKFENSVDAGWINGGRPGVNVSLAIGDGNGSFPTPSANQEQYLKIRVFHDASEPYIDYGNYRISYFSFDPTIKCFEGATGCPTGTGWGVVNDITQGFVKATTVGAFQEMITPGQDSIGKWNQRIVFQFPHQLATITQQLQQYDSRTYIHQGALASFRGRWRIFASNYNPVDWTDDWSYNPTALSSDDGLYFPIGDDHTDPDPTKSGVPVTTWHKSACQTAPFSIKNVLIEEWDGYTWRRVFGTGPLPGRDITNVSVMDTLPLGVTFKSFSKKNALDIDATTSVLSDGRTVIKWSIPKMQVNQKDSILYIATVSGNCPGTEKDILNKAWIQGDAESASPGIDTIHVTCTPITICPTSTSITKSSDKSKYTKGETVTYTIKYAQTQGSIADSALSSSANWTSQLGGNGATFSGNTLTTPASVKLVETYDYSYGTNTLGDGIEGTVQITQNEGDFALVLRHTGGAIANGIYVKIAPGGQNNPTIVNFYNGTNLNTPINSTPFSIPFYASVYDYRIQLNGGTLSMWLVPTGTTISGTATIIQSGIPVRAGYTGVAHGLFTNNYYASHVVSNWSTHLDAAFNVQIVDSIPKGIISASIVSPTGTSNAAAVTWTLATGKTPIPYDTTKKYTLVWKGTYNTCGKITNIAYVNTMGITGNQYGVCYDINCADATCVPPTTVATSPKTVTVCLGQKATLHGTSTLGTSPLTGYRYVWYKSGNPPAASTYKTAYADSLFLSSTLANAGTYVLRVEDGTAGTASCYKEDTVKLVVNTLPTAAFTRQPTTNPITAGTQVTFANTSTGATSSQWKIDGVTATINPTYTFATQGTYKVRLVVSNAAGCKDSTEQTINVGVAPTCQAPTALSPKPASGKISVCEGDSAKLSATYTLGTNPLNTYHYVWYKQGTSPSNYANNTTYTDKVFSKTVASTDSGHWVLRIEDGSSGTDASCYKEVVIQLVVNPLPNVSAGRDTAVCVGSTIRLNGSSSTASVTFAWSKIGGNYASSNAKSSIARASLADSGLYILKGTIGTCSKSDTVHVGVNPLPSPALSSDTVTQCGGTVDLTSLTSFSGTKVFYSDTLVPTILSNTTVSTSGTYYLQVTNGAGCTSKFGTGKIKVQIKPGPVASIDQPSASYCGNLGTTLSASSSGNGELYEWFNDAGSLGSPSTSNILNNVLEGNYTVQVTVNGCTSAKSAAVAVTKTDNATPTVVISSNQQGTCPGQTISFRANPSNATSYEWYVGTQKQPSDSAVFTSTTLQNKDTVKVVWTTDEACFNPKTAVDTLVIHLDTASASLQISTLETLPVCEGQVIHFTATTPYGNTLEDYQWSVNDQGQSSTDNTFLSNSLKNGDVVKVSAHDACPPSNLVTATLPVRLTPSEVPSLVLKAMSTKVCAGQTATFHVDSLKGASTPTYTWYVNGDPQSPTSVDSLALPIVDAATVFVQLTSNDQCANPRDAFSDTVTVTPQQKVKPYVSMSKSPVLCPTDKTAEFDIMSFGGADDVPDFQWYVNDQAQPNAKGTSFTSSTLAQNDQVYVVLTSHLSCRTQDTATSSAFSYQPPVAFKVSIDQNVNGKYAKDICKGDATTFETITTVDGATYKWYLDGVEQVGEVNNTFTPANIQNGDSIRVVASLPNCAVSNVQDETVVHVLDQPQNGFVGGVNTFSYCPGKGVTIIALETNNAFTYTWKQGTEVIETGTKSHIFTSSGAYSLVIQNGVCSTTVLASVQQGSLPLSLMPKESTFSPGEAVTLTAEVAEGGKHNYTWSPSNLIQSADSQITFFPIETVYVTVLVTNQDGCSALDSALVRKLDKLFIPNAITPETGDQNAFWNIKGAEAYPELDVRVYNRWGSLVHQQKGYGTAWDGTLNGKDLPTGTYYYVLKDKSLGQPRVGDLTIVR